MSEELRIIMDALAQLGAAGKEAFIWWLVIKYVGQNLFAIAIVSIIGFVILKVARVIKEHQEEYRICKLVYEKSHGSSYYYGGSNQIEAVEKWLRGK